MKFLITGKMKDMALAVPIPLYRQLTEAGVAVINKQKKEGKVQEAYWIPGVGTTVIIGEANTAEELVKNFNEAPISAYMSFEIFPLADFNESMKIIIERLKAAEKLFPSAAK